MSDEVGSTGSTLGKKQIKVSLLRKKEEEPRRAWTYLVIRILSSTSAVFSSSLSSDSSVPPALWDEFAERPDDPELRRRMALEVGWGAFQASRRAAALTARVAFSLRMKEKEFQGESGRKREREG